MRNLMTTLGVLAWLGITLAQIFGGVSTPTQADVSHDVDIRTKQSSVPPLVRCVEITRNAGGHFLTEGMISGQNFGFMIDTGATLVALNETSAARLGLRPTAADYSSTVSTANGTIKAAHARLGMIEVGGVMVNDVDAMILPDASLKENLLGMSFLSKLKRMEYADDKMVLKQ